MPIFHTDPAAPVSALPASAQTALSTLSALSMDALEDEIGSLCSHLNAATYRLLVLIAELGRREPWGRFGCKSCAHYLNWVPALRQYFGMERKSFSAVR